jgi:hypothetical protein
MIINIKRRLNIMIDKLKKLLTNWKVSVVLVGGAVVVATVFGTCTFEPGADVESETKEESETPGADVSTTTSGGEGADVDVDANIETEDSETTAN